MFSLMLTYRGHFLPSALVLVIAVFFDYMDGRVARSIGGSSAFGEELDSLADALSFGAAPAFLIYAKYVDNGAGTLATLGTAFFALCGVLRLARFNVTHVAGNFQGLPIPAAGMALASIVIAGIPLTPYAAVAAMVLLGGLMISTVPYGNLKLLRRGNVNKLKAAILMGVAISFCVALKEKALLALIGVYIASGPLHFDWGAWLSINPRQDERPSMEK
jgi:CDP-diacylglycerol--serine O-phosphatidyltransferase